MSIQSDRVSAAAATTPSVSPSNQAEIRTLAPADETATKRIPVLGQTQKLDTSSIRHPTENVFVGCIFAFNIIVFAAIALGLPRMSPEELLVVLGVPLLWYITNKLAFALFYWYLHGNSVKVSETQYPEVYAAVKAACAYIDLPRIPTVFVMHGRGVLELFLVKRFTRRGILVFTSELIDNLLDAGDSRELMMIIGRQLGHIKMGHYKFWFCKDVIGAFTFLIHRAWWRRCHYSADRVGFLVAGSLEASRRALIVLTVGKKLAIATRIEALEEQDGELQDHFFAWLSQITQPYPFVIRRIIELEAFRDHVVERPYNASSTKEVGILPPEVSRFQVINITGQAIFGERGTISIVRAAT